MFNNVPFQVEKKTIIIQNIYVILNAYLFKLLFLFNLWFCITIIHLVKLHRHLLMYFSDFRYKFLIIFRRERRVVTERRLHAGSARGWRCYKPIFGSEISRRVNQNDKKLSIKTIMTD